MEETWNIYIKPKRFYRKVILDNNYVNAEKWIVKYTWKVCLRLRWKCVDWFVKEIKTKPLAIPAYFGSDLCYINEWVDKTIISCRF